VSGVIHDGKTDEEGNIYSSTFGKMLNFGVIAEGDVVPHGRLYVSPDHSIGLVNSLTVYDFFILVNLSAASSMGEKAYSAFPSVICQTGVITIARSWWWTEELGRGVPRVEVYWPPVVVRQPSSPLLAAARRACDCILCSRAF
jgi:hypothetical protein